MDRKAFSVSNIYSYNPALGPPKTAEDYLRSVIIERKTLPRVIVSDINPRDFDAKRTSIHIQQNGSVFSPNFLPDREWIDSVLGSFEELRLGLRDLEIQLDKKKEGMEMEKREGLEGAGGEGNQACNRVLPHANDEVAWERICMGGKLLPDDVTFTRPPEKPILEMVAMITELIIIKLISYGTNWITKFEVNEDRAEWFYYIFAKLEEPILDNTADDLRKLLDFFVEERAKLKSKEDAMLFHYNRLITIISEYFGQVQLTEDALPSKKRWRSRMWEESQRKKPRKEIVSIPINFRDFADEEDEEEDYEEEEYYEEYSEKPKEVEDGEIVEKEEGELEDGEVEEGEIVETTNAESDIQPSEDQQNDQNLNYENSQYAGYDYTYTAETDQQYLPQPDGTQPDSTVQQPDGTMQQADGTQDYSQYVQTLDEHGNPVYWDYNYYAAYYQTYPESTQNSENQNTNPTIDTPTQQEQHTSPTIDTPTPQQSTQPDSHPQ